MNKLSEQINLLELIRKTYKSGESDKALYAKILKAFFRYLTDMYPVKYKSKAADEKAKELKIPLDKMTWQNQKKWDEKRSLFHYEHCNPISELIEDVLERDKKIEDIIKEDFVCWILKTEDKQLTEHKYRSNRPGGWEKCYKDCKIEVLENTKEEKND